MRPSKRLLVCDLDNTLYDWVGYFVRSFYAMVDEVVRITGCDRERLLDDFRKVHQRHCDSEHPFALLETQLVTDLFPGRARKDVAQALDPAFHAFNAMRKRTLSLHSGVREGLDVLQAAGVILVAHTDSKLFGAADRLIRLEIAPYFRRIYCRERPDAVHPAPSSVDGWLERLPMDKVLELSPEQAKPNPDVLLEICRMESVQPSDAAYVGDSIARDMLMAKNAGVYGIWAKYGADHSSEDYERLVRISHWTADDVRRERQLCQEAQLIRPDVVAETSFVEVLRALGVQQRAALSGVERLR